MLKVWHSIWKPGSRFIWTTATSFGSLLLIWKPATEFESLLLNLKACHLIWKSSIILESMLLYLEACALSWKLGMLFESLVFVPKPCYLFWTPATLFEPLLLDSKPYHSIWNPATEFETLLHNLWQIILRSQKSYWGLGADTISMSDTRMTSYNPIFLAATAGQKVTLSVRPSVSIPNASRCSM